ncbi:putative histone H2A.3 [Dendrobium catenatum]|uniref:Histone H2A n=1 Tax=Dendrobium catenatum TaxID=906689 RepID=A0A2I0VYW0_9ASPA|nr:putative histone H2A.3 [Dendrobium catenatum]
MKARRTTPRIAFALHSIRLPAAPERKTEQKSHDCTKIKSTNNTYTDQNSELYSWTSFPFPEPENHQKTRPAIPISLRRNPDLSLSLTVKVQLSKQSSALSHCSCEIKAIGTAASKKATSRSSKAGLKFSVGRIARFLMVGKYSEHVGAGAPVYMATDLQYLAAEVWIGVVSFLASGGTIVNFLTLGATITYFLMQFLIQNHLCLLAFHGLLPSRT